jgi:hypothetical protein
MVHIGSNGICELVAWRRRGNGIDRRRAGIGLRGPPTCVNRIVALGSHGCSYFLFKGRDSPVPALSAESRSFVSGAGW